jgi:hypothetical protein
MHVRSMVRHTAATTPTRQPRHSANHTGPTLQPTELAKGAGADGALMWHTQTHTRARMSQPARPILALFVHGHLRSHARARATVRVPRAHTCSRRERLSTYVSRCACVRARVRACVRANARACARMGRVGRWRARAVLVLSRLGPYRTHRRGEHRSERRVGGRCRRRARIRSDRRVHL